MSKNNWYSTGSWYAPLYNDPAPKSDRGSKRRRLSFGWRLGIASVLVLGLIVLSSVLFSGGEPEQLDGFVPGGEMPEDWQDYFGAYYAETEGLPMEINLEKLDSVPDFYLDFTKPEGEELSLKQLYEK